MKVTLDWTSGQTNYLTNLALLIRGIMSGVNEVLTNTAGVTYSARVVSGTSGVQGISTGTTIQFGSSTGASVMSGVSLGALINSSIATVLTNLDDTVSGLQWQNSQSSGVYAANQNLNEIGLAATIYKTVNTVETTLLVRHVLISGVAVAQGDAVTGKFVHTVNV